ncbi:MAG: 1-deoxy-D-xylulose-5-phosphate reductoisomerase [bacterium]|nr:1-deoxy-D-xylulose-5-phosphate reductoisomerase [bacterium]
MTLTRRKRLLIQGVTGSIGCSTLDVVRAHHDLFQVVGIAARHSLREVQAIAQEFGVESKAMSEAQPVLSAHASPVRWILGEDALAKQAMTLDYDLLVNAVTGSAGLESTQAALARGIPVALANKETLVAAGSLIMRSARDHSAQVIPIDSEHSAILQCLQGEDPATIRKLWLTTSGGPFWDRPREELATVTVAQALHHPTWGMGAKISIDSATLFNKGLEVIEAAHLFNMDIERIGIVAHRQSIVHSMIEFADGSVKAQLSAPDMRLPILFALSYPQRVTSDLVRTTVDSLGCLSFHPVPLENFPCFRLALAAMRRSGTAPAAISAADEIAVSAFLEGTVGFLDIARILETVLKQWPDEVLNDFRQVRQADERARHLARACVLGIATGKETVHCS